MLRVSTTSLESFRRILHTDYGSEAELIASIKREPFVPSWQMDAGKAWHAVLEGAAECHPMILERDALEPPDVPPQPPRKRLIYFEEKAAVAVAAEALAESLRIDALVKHYESGGYYFDRNVVERARQIIGPGLWEQKETKQYRIGRHDVNVVAQVDHKSGLVLQENKTKFSQPYARDYEESLQWRFYLEVHEALRCNYNLWHFAEPTSDGHCESKGMCSFTFWHYPGLERDCVRWLREFMAWAEGRELLEYLDREGT